MNLIDEDELNTTNDRKIKKAIIISIIILVILGAIIIGLIIYKLMNPTSIITLIDGNRVQNLSEILDVQEDENGETEIYIPIREFATYLNSINEEYNYESYKGDYNPKTEDESKCYVIREGFEVAIFTQKTKTIYKLNLQNNNNDSEYTQVNIDKDIFLSNGNLYASLDGIEKGYNVSITYDKKKKILNIYTMDRLISGYQQILSKTTMGDYGKLTIDLEEYENGKAIFQDLAIVESDSGKYGIIKISDTPSFILEPQYDNIKYIYEFETFLVESNYKVGVFSKDGKRKIDMIYDEISSMGQESNLYVVKTNNQYGVINENGKIIIYPEHERIGIDINDFLYNGVKNGYFILNKLIPVMQNDKWAFFDKNGKNITNGFKYTNIGCSKVKTGNNVYGLLQLLDYDVIVVGDDLGKYWFMDSSGRDDILPHVFDQVYTKTSEGKESYLMTYNEKDYNVLKYIKQIKQ